MATVWYQTALKLQFGRNCVYIFSLNLQQVEPHTHDPYVLFLKIYHFQYNQTLLECIPAMSALDELEITLY